MPMSRLIWRLIRPYRAMLVVIFLAMLVQTAMGVAAPWPLKVVVDSVVGDHTMDDVGIKVHKLKHLKLHGKMLLADHARAIIGSINLAPGSFDSRRELAIEVHTPEVVERLRKIVHHDWHHSHQLDMSDEGLLEEFQEHQIDAAEQLALDVRPGHATGTKDHHR